MAMTNAQRQARHRERVKAAQASLAQRARSRYASVPEEIVAQLERNWLAFEDGIIELFNTGSWGNSSVECIRESHGAAVGEWNALDLQGKLVRMEGVMRVAGHGVALEMSERHLRAWRTEHPQPAPGAGVSGPFGPSTSPRLRYRTVLMLNPRSTIRKIPRCESK